MQTHLLVMMNAQVIVEFQQRDNQELIFETWIVPQFVRL